MKLVSLKVNGREIAALVAPHGFVLMDSINVTQNADWKTDAFGLLQEGQWERLGDWYRSGGAELLEDMPAIPEGEALRAPLYRHPRKIWGIGMNYVSGPDELRQLPPDWEPVGFLKPDTALIGHGDPIRLPAQSARVTAEAELAMVIGRTCKNISEAEAPGAVAGFAAALDMTAADIHEKNPRFLTRAKSFDTFFSFGSELATPDEWPEILDIAVETSLNGRLQHRNVTANMCCRPWAAIAFLSRVMTLLPGDIILTGTPGAVKIAAGDRAECRISGLAELANPVANA